MEQGKRVYLVGIKGAGMAGLAQILQGMGYEVTGSDISDTFFTDDILKANHIPFYETFDASHITKDIDWTISSAAYLPTTNDQRPTTQNEEIQELKKQGIPIYGYSEVLAKLFNKAYGIAITGTHGKSTVSAMIAYIVEQAGKDPFALIGAELLNWNSNARVARSQKLKAKSYFVIEADEYREQFLKYHPGVIVITNIGYDHPDYFPTQKAYKEAFERFKKNLKPQGFVINGPALKLQASSLKLQVFGRHNQQNAALAYAVCRKLGIADDVIRNALASFKGTRRRLERIGEYRGATIIDDYAHHPEEIEASLSALKEANLGRVIVLFHPHTYSRTAMFLKEFAHALTKADEIYLLDVYASAREKAGSVNSESLAAEISKLGAKAKNLKTIENAIQYMETHLKKNDVLVTMGAGDVFRVAEQLINSKNARTTNKN